MVPFKLIALGGGMHNTVSFWTPEHPEHRELEELSIRLDAGAIIVRPPDGWTASDLP